MWNLLRQEMKAVSLHIMLCHLKFIHHGHYVIKYVCLPEKIINKFY